MEEVPKIKETPWLKDAAKKWKEMDWGERQFWLSQVADEQNLPKVRFLMTHKHFDFDKIPDEYQKILAQKWGSILIKF